MATQTIPVNDVIPEFSLIPLDSLHESPWNARRLYNLTQLEELSTSIKANGIVQPILVRALGVNDYEVVAGSRRRRAALLAGLDSVPVIIREMSDEQAREVSLIENIQREDVHPMHEALGMQDALTVGGYDVGRLASRLGKHERHIYKRLQLCRLIEPLQQSYLDGWWSLAAITEASKLTEEQQTMAHGHFFPPDRQRQYTINDRDITGWINYNVLVILKKAVFDLKDAELVPAAGACVGCQKRTGASPMLWEDTEEDQCTDPACYKGKVEAFMAKKREKLVKKHGENGFVQISSHFRRHETDAKKTIIGSEAYTEVEKGSCEFAKPGLNVEGDLGKIKWVCLEKLCPIHGKDTTSTDPDRIRQKAAEKESAVRGRIFLSILKQYPAETSRKLREFIAVKFANRLSHDVDLTLAKLLKLETAKNLGPNYPGLVKGMSDRELEVFMLAIALVPDAKTYTYQSLDRTGPLFEIAAEFGVDIEAIDSYCNAYYLARMKKGNDRKQSMNELPPDPVTVVQEVIVESKPVAKASKRKAKKSA